MNKNIKTRTVKISINLPMNFPEDWDDNMINFHLNDSSWCWSNIIDKIKEYAESSGGCICGICSGEVVPKKEQDIREELGAKSFDELVPSCPNCTCLESCKEDLKNPDIVVKCLWYGWLKNKIGDGKNENLL